MVLVLMTMVLMIMSFGAERLYDQEDRKKYINEMDQSSGYYLVR
jgi:hypothetical protein